MATEASPALPNVGLQPLVVQPLVTPPAMPAALPPVLAGPMLVPPQVRRAVNGRPSVPAEGFARTWAGVR